MDNAIFSAENTVLLCENIQVWHISERESQLINEMLSDKEPANFELQQLLELGKNLL